MTQYLFRVKGHSHERLSAALPEFTCVAKQHTTAVMGEIVDQAALHAVLWRLRSLGLELIEVRPVGGPHGPDDDEEGGPEAGGPTAGPPRCGA